MSMTLTINTINRSPINRSPINRSPINRSPINRSPHSLRPCYDPFFSRVQEKVDWRRAISSALEMREHGEVDGRCASRISSPGSGMKMERAGQ